MRRKNDENEKIDFLPFLEIFAPKINEISTITSTPQNTTTETFSAAIIGLQIFNLPPVKTNKLSCDSLQKF